MNDGGHRSRGISFRKYTDQSRKLEVWKCLGTNAEASFVRGEMTGKARRDKRKHNRQFSICGVCSFIRNLKI